MGWNYEGWVLKFGWGLGQKMPGAGCVRTQRLDRHNTHSKMHDSKLSTFIFFKYLPDHCVAQQSDSLQEIWLKHPCSVDFGHDLGGCLPGTGS